jgi:cardiolipin synthase
MPKEMNIFQLERIYGGKFGPGNRITVFHDVKDAFLDIFREIDRARESICLVFYIFRNDVTGSELAELLKTKAREGVRVCLLYDHFGSLFTPRWFWQSLKEAGAEVKASRPLKWKRPREYIYRDHRKLIVIDGKIAFTGGLNIADEYRPFRHRIRGWRDTAVRVEGPAALKLYDIFDKTWQFWKGTPFAMLSGEKVPSFEDGLSVMPIFSSSARGRRKIRKLLHWCIRESQSQISLTTAYFTPSRRLIQILAEAVERGVRVRLLLPSKSDISPAQYAGRAFFLRLLKSGVEIYLYQDTVLHAKSYVFDDVFSIVGSANLDFQSLRKNDEGNVGVYDERFAREMEMIFAMDIGKSRKVDLDEWRKRPLCDKIKERFFVLFRMRL